MMCYVKFPEAWFKWLDILHASLVPVHRPWEHMDAAWKANVNAASAF